MGCGARQGCDGIMPSVAEQHRRRCLTGPGRGNTFRSLAAAEDETQPIQQLDKGIQGRVLRQNLHGEQADVEWTGLHSGRKTLIMSDASSTRRPGSAEGANRALLGGPALESDYPDCGGGVRPIPADLDDRGGGLWTR